VRTVPDSGELDLDVLPRRGRPRLSLPAHRDNPDVGGDLLDILDAVPGAAPHRPAQDQLVAQGGHPDEADREVGQGKDRLAREGTGVEQPVSHAGQ
jgi:hypothetical protein